MASLQFQAVLAELDSGIGKSNLKSPLDRMFAFDYDHSGKLDHLCVYRPGKGTFWILRNERGVFPAVYEDQHIGGFDLASEHDRAFAFDYEHSGMLDHICLYRPGSGAFWIAQNKGGVFKPVYAEGHNGKGIGGFDLRSIADRAFAFDYDHSGKQDHICLYRPGTGTFWILKHTEDKFTPVYARGDPGDGIGGYNLSSVEDIAFAFDYTHSGKADYIVLYRPGGGNIAILQHEGSSVFIPVHFTDLGVGGYDLKLRTDTIMALDIDHSGKQDHLMLFRRGKGKVRILKHSGAAYGTIYDTEDGGIGGFNLRSENDHAFAFDYDSSGKLDHLVLYRPGVGMVWIVRH